MTNVPSINSSYVSDNLAATAVCLSCRLHVKIFIRVSQKEHGKQRKISTSFIVHIWVIYYLGMPLSERECAFLCFRSVFESERKCTGVKKRKIGKPAPPRHLSYPLPYPVPSKRRSLRSHSILLWIRIQNAIRGE